MTLNFETHFLSLPSIFYTPMDAQKISKAPFLIHLNPTVASLINLSPNDFSDADFVRYFSGAHALPDSSSYASVYSGHQFGQWAGQLGDGRTLTLGQVRGTQNKLFDLQLKGSGQTPYSRFGDGRAVLRSSIREYLGAEALFGLGIPTTRSLCLIGTGEKVRREQWEPGAMITRVSESFIRFGHFEHFFYHFKSSDYLQLLLNHVIQTYFPSLHPTSPDLWLQEVVKRSATLVAQWQSIGFCHGVLNTDNMSILGETLDYGPFGFLEAFDPNWVCNHSDHDGRYAYNQQPHIFKWNLMALAYALSPLIDRKKGAEIVAEFDGYFKTSYHQLMTQKLGLDANNTDDITLLYALLDLMSAQKSDYTLTFRRLVEAIKGDCSNWLALFKAPETALQWLERYLKRVTPLDKPLLCNHLRQSNPKYILRNWVAEYVIRQVETQQNYDCISQILALLHDPYSEHPQFEYFSTLPPDGYQEISISCSS